MSDTSVERAFAILETFGQERRPLSMKELAERCRIPASTCHSLVHTLLKHAWLYQTGHRKDLYPTRRLHDLGAVILASDPLLQRLDPVMDALRDETRETVILGKRQRDAVLYLDVREGPQVIRYSASSGDTKPLHSSSIGKALLSVLPEAELRALLDGMVLPDITGTTITDIDRLIADIARGREQGCQVTRGENVPDVTALAVPIFINNECFALAVAGPSHRMSANEGMVRAALASAVGAVVGQDTGAPC